MGINPFNEANLQNLQNQVCSLISNSVSPLLTSIKKILSHIKIIGKINITIMIVPHSEKKIINLHMPVFKIFLLASILITAVTAASLKIADYNYIVKDISKLSRYGEGSDFYFRKYKNEINRLYNKFQDLKPEINSLYALIFKNENTLWAKGGDSAAIQDVTDIEKTYPSIEELNIKELRQELETTNVILFDIVNSLKKRKIIDSTPSAIPVKGYILSKSVIKASPFLNENESRQGIEIAAFPGSPIKTPAPGKVDDITWDKIFGLSVTIKHKYGFSSIISHCQDIVVKKGQKVSKGETIAHVGKTGMTNKYVCYYQIKIGTEFIDSFPFIFKKK